MRLFVNGYEVSDEFAMTIGTLGRSGVEYANITFSGEQVSVRAAEEARARDEMTYVSDKEAPEGLDHAAWREAVTVLVERGTLSEVGLRHLNDALLAYHRAVTRPDL